jgi:phage/plasmid primase-like uncharacterized protein
MPPIERNTVPDAVKLLTHLSETYQAKTGQDIVQPGRVPPKIADKLTLLNVSYQEREEAKALGARWDAQKDSWYVPKGVDLNKFERWIAPDKGPDMPQDKTPDAKKSPSVETDLGITVLRVPYAEKDAASSLGARWDTRNKFWFVPKNMDPAPFQKWIPKNVVEPLTSLDPVSEFKENIKKCGLVIEGEPIMNGQIQRVPVEGGGPGKRDGSYLGHLDGRPNGWVQNHKTGEKTKWVYTGQELSQAQRESLSLEAETRREEQERQRQINQQLAIRRAVEKLAQNSQNNAQALNGLGHPYLDKKKVQAVEGVQFERVKDQVNILIPGGVIQNGAPPVVQTIQTITPEGRKYFEAGCPKTGASFVLEPMEPSKKMDFVYQKWLANGKDPNNTPSISICEGYATACSVLQALDKPVVCAFDSGNLKEVAKNVRAAYPEANIVICADNDRSLTDERKNVGVEKGLEAAKAIGGGLAYPNFTDDEVKKGLTDFNDLVVLRGPERGFEEIKRLVSAAEKQAGLQLESNSLGDKAPAKTAFMNRPTKNGLER